MSPSEMRRSRVKEFVQMHGVGSTTVDKESAAHFIVKYFD